MESQNDQNDQNPWKTIHSRSVYSNNWIEVTHRDVLNPVGQPGIYGTVHFRNIAVGVLALDEKLNTWLVGQYRFPIDCYSWEIPEGGGAMDCDPLLSAKRELKEETGLSARLWTPLLESHLSNSVSDEKAVIYLAQGLTQGDAEPEDTEVLKLRRLPFGEVFDMVMRGDITDSMAMMAIMKVQLLLERGELASVSD